MPKFTYSMYFYKLYYIFCIFILVFCSKVAFSQETSLKFKQFSVEESLPTSITYALAQDAKGFIWAGTQDGLARFDGYNMLVFKHKQNDSTSLPINNISKLFIDSENNLWIGTWGGGICLYNPEMQTFKTFDNQKNNKKSLSENRIHCIFEDENKNLWIGTTNGLNLFDKKTGTFERFFNKKGDKNTLANNKVWTMAKSDQKDHFWIGTQNGLNLFNTKSKQFTVFRNDSTQENSLVHNEVRTLWAEPNGDLWIGTYKGIDRYEPKKQKFVHYPQVKDAINCFYKSLDKKLYIGTQDSGLVVLDTRKQTLESFKNNPKDFESISNNDIRSILLDKFGVLWIATRNGGVNKVSITSSAFHHIFAKPFDSNTLSSNNIRTFLELNEKLWLGTLGGGLNRYDPKTGIYTVFKNDPKNPNSLPNDNVRALCLSNEQKIWVGTRRGLAVFDEKKQNFRIITLVDHEQHGIYENSIWRMFFDKDNILWIATESGLCRFDPKTEKYERFYVEKPNLDEKLYQEKNWIQNIFEDSDGFIWASLRKGLARFNKKTQKFETFEQISGSKLLEKIGLYFTHEDEQKRLWFGTYSFGIFVYDKKTNFLKNYTSEDGLPNDVTYQLLADSEGYFWVSTNQGLSKFKPSKNLEDKIYFRNYKYSDGLQGNEFNFGAAMKSQNGELYFGGINGLNHFDPAEIESNNVKPELVITDFQIFGESVGKSKNYKHLLPKNITETEKIILEYDHNIFTFEYAALHYVTPDQNLYAIKMEGFDKDWHVVGKRRFATYTNLDPGTYIFKVKACNSDGIWNEEGAEIEVVITPPWWMTTIFRCFVVVFVVFFAYFFYKNRVRQIETQKEKLAELVNQQTEELAEQNQEISQKNEELKQQHTYLEDKNAEISLRSQEVMASISYAQRIQQATLPAIQKFSEALPDSFVFFSPKDIVSGDFYWFFFQDDQQILAVLDCTGHGVPGGFMSMIGTNLLNEIVKHRKIFRPDLILNELHKGVVEFLQQEESKVSDGMDAAICCLKNTENKIYLEYAGAKNPMYFIQNGEIDSLKGDKFPIGDLRYGNKERLFTKHDMILEQETSFYLLSDGYEDQFGGENDRKFTRNRFKNLLLEIYELPMEEQRNQLEKNLKSWIGKGSQVDDILVMGVKLLKNK
ncbi:MAG: hypothetical protein EAZ97_09725 [Bacteroidetes bacterium]|nr:MAG: hypothetical protein EAZ97_09725 [Bacteroidota bacterium]